MKKSVRIQLNKYPKIPSTLQSARNSVCTDLSVVLADLYHHYFQDTYGRNPPSPDEAHFEHVQFLMPSSDFRIQGSSLGASTSVRRSRSSELGQAFCRWFLDTHLGITYFAHISELMGRQNVRPIVNCTVRRAMPGDTPDYLCAESPSKIFLAEAKGRYSSIGFKNKEFQQWRDQFERIEILDGSGKPRQLKGHIVATRFATEDNNASINTTIFAEDPYSNGEGPLEGEPATNLGAAIIGIHYGKIAEKLNQPLLATALINGLALPEEILVRVVFWELIIDSNKKRRFVGGYFPGTDGKSIFKYENGQFLYHTYDPFRLDQPRGTFVGIEENIFREIVRNCRNSGKLHTQLPQLENNPSFYSAISMLRDGSVVGPIEFFNPIGFGTL